MVCILLVNNTEVTGGFTTLEEAKGAAKPYMPSEAKLQIKSFENPIGTWNYKYELKEWRELLPRG